MTTPSEAPAGPSRACKRLTLVSAILGASVTFLDQTTVTLTLPAIQRELPGVTTATQQWVVSSYLLTLSAFLLVGGRLGDVYGRRRLFRVGLAAYASLELVAALAPSAVVLVAARTLLGVAGAVLASCTLALIAGVFPPDERGRAIGTWAAWSGVSTLLGPLLAGAIVDRASWRLVFAVMPAVALVALLLSRGIPESRDETASRRLDVAGGLLAVTGLGACVYALIEAQSAGWAAPRVVTGLVAGLALLGGFVVRERYAPEPMLPLRLFENRNLAAANVTTLLLYAALGGAAFYLPIYVQSGLGKSAVLAGLAFTPVTLPLMVLSPVAGRYADRHGPRRPMTLGPLIAAAGLAVASLTGPGDYFTRLLPGIALFGVGMGVTVAPLTATAVGSAEARYAGIASGVSNAVARLAGLLAIVLLGVVVTGVWHARMDALATELPPTAAAAVRDARATVFVAPPTPPSVPAATRRLVAETAGDAARDAFRRGMLAAALLAALGGAASWAWIRDPVPGTATAPARSAAS